MTARCRLGVMFVRELPPERLVPFCLELEALGVDEVWVIEDLEWASSIASAATALAATERLHVGIGIAPAPLRNPVLLAMELATLARLHPGRLRAGIGHGVADWMRRVGAMPRSQLALLEETISAVRALLHGETVTTEGREVRLDGVKLVHPPEPPPPVLAGVVKPRSLELSGRVADGTIVIEGRGPDQVAEARAHIDRGRAAAGTSWPHELVVYTHLYVDDDADRVRAVVDPVVDEYARFLEVERSDVFVPAGPVGAVAAQIESLWEARADGVVLHPLGDEPLESVRRLLAALPR